MATSPPRDRGYGRYGVHGQHDTDALRPAAVQWRQKQTRLEGPGRRGSQGPEQGSAWVSAQWGQSGPEQGPEQGPVRSQHGPTVANGAQQGRLVRVVRINEEEVRQSGSARAYRDQNWQIYRQRRPQRQSWCLDTATTATGPATECTGRG